jgi:hypothetical protein
MMVMYVAFLRAVAMYTHKAHGSITNRRDRPAQMPWYTGGGSAESVREHDN